MIKHPSEKVRKTAVRVLLARDPKFVQQLFPLISDPESGIRKDILSSIATQRSSTAENLLLKYLKENFGNKDTEHLLACYATLGSCGSATAIPFLRKILLGQGWNRFSKSGRLVHREGAATALTLLDTWEANDILLAASNSRFQVIRQAFQMAMAKIDTSKEYNNG